MNMDNSNQIKSSSSFSDLFGAKESPPQSSAAGFASLFPPPSSMPRRNSASGDFLAPKYKQASGSQVWSTKHGTTGAADNVAKDTENANNKPVNKERGIFQESVEPCPLSSSLYYGGQEDMYIKSSADRTSQPYSKEILETLVPV